MGTGSIGRSDNKPRTNAAPAPVEAQPVKQTAAAEAAKPPTPAQPPAPAADRFGAAREAAPEPGRAATLEAPSTLRRSSRPSEANEAAAGPGAAAASGAGAAKAGSEVQQAAPDQQVQSDAKKSATIKPGAADAWKEVDKDPRVTGKVREELGKLVGSAGFQNLDDKGQAEALRLAKGNIGDPPDPAGLGRVNTAVNNIFSVKSPNGKQQMLEGLTKGSPLTDEKVSSMRNLTQAPGFQSLQPADQERIAEGFKGAGADPKVTDGYKGLVDDPKFGALKPEQKTSVLDTLKQGSPLNEEKLSSTKGLMLSPSFQSLPAGDQQKITEGLSGAKTDPKVANTFKSMIEDPKFQSASAAEKSSALTASKALVSDPKFGSLSPDTQNKVLETLSRNPTAADSMRKLGSLVRADNFQGLNATQQAAVLDVFQKTSLEGQGNLVDLTNRSVTSGSPPVTRPALLDVDSKGGTLLDSLQKIANGPLSPEYANKGISRESLLSTVMQETAKPDEINQGTGPGTCTATNMSYMLSSKNPAEYARLTAGLLGPEGKVEMANGETLTRVPDSIPVESSPTGRSATERALISSIMSYGRGDKGYSVEGDIAGKGDGDMGGDAQRKTLSALFNQKHSEVAADKYPNNKDEIVDALKARAPQQSYVCLSWGEKKGGSHMVAVDKVEGNPPRVYLRNPWGHGGSSSHPPCRAEAPPKGYGSMSVEDFKKWVVSASVPE